MINFFKKILPWIIPEKEINFIKKTAVYLKNFVSQSKNNQYLLNNKSLENKYSGERCFIIGNGGSIKQLDLLKLKDEYTFSINLFTKHEKLDQINPKFYCDIEPFDLMSKTYTKDCLYHPDNYYPQIEEAFKNLDTTMFFHYGCKPFFEKKGLFKNKSVHYLKGSTSFLQNEKYSLKNCSDISRPFSFMDGSIYNAICCCAYMGFKELYLIGFDADYILKNSESHFYKEPEIIYAEGVKRYDWSVPETESNKTLALHLYNHLEKLEVVKKYFETKEVKIFNAGIGGFIDTFERVDFDKLF